MEAYQLDFKKNGFVKVENLLNKSEVLELASIYTELLSDKEKTAHLRSDLAGAGNTSDKVERITQIMRPSIVDTKLAEHIAYKKAKQWAQNLLGDDMELDFDMLINKAPNTDTETPWHQDAAYWIAMPDKRAVSCWIALDKVFEENGCMWFIPRSTDETILKHQNLPNGGALYCETETKNAHCVPLEAGSCTFHDGFTLHFSKGNSTNVQRRALILNFRPKGMIAYEREKVVDHTGERKSRNS
mgnify:CR=1 FL=1